MDTYLVARPFSGYEVGAVLSGANFTTPHRAKQLVDLRFLTRTESEKPAGYQPTASALNGATIRQLAQLLTDVVDAGVLRDALSAETRESAIKAIEKRLAEMDGTDEPSN